MATKPVHLSLSSLDVYGHANSPVCTVYEYGPSLVPFNNCARAFIVGNYPEKGYVMNRECDELIFVKTGSGSIRIKNADKTCEEWNLKSDHVFLIPKGAKFRYIIGDLEGLHLFVITSPKFTKEQHVHLVDE